MSSILPKGIVVNTPEISGDIQKIDREPLALEEIAKFWKVYTTTKRRLVDPTAERLENFWWRIWGSRKRNLRGATVARIFADISDEISFVPLRGPLNRDESGGRPTSSLARSPGMASTTAIHGRQESDSSNGRQSSSLSKSVAALPPPILKKSRGPSNTGPRPTARFISPQTSDEENVAEFSPIAGPGAHVIVRPPTPPTPVSQRVKDEKKAETSVGPRRRAHGHVATTSTHKRRPGVLRRPNSDPAARAQESGSNSSNTNERPELRISQSQLGQTSPSPETLLSVNRSKISRSGKSGHSKTSAQQSLVSKKDLERDLASSSASHGLQGQIETGNQPWSIGGEHNCEVTVQGVYLEPRSATSSQSIAAHESSSALRSKEVVQNRPAERHIPKNLDGKSSISVAPTYTTATRETDQQDKHRLETMDRQDAPCLDKDGESSSRTTDQASFFAKRPVQPAKSASALFSSPTHQSNGSMSRSKSQLTLLLEIDRAKEKENKERPDSASKSKDAKQR